MTNKTPQESGDKIVTTMCASHCGGSCILKLHVRDGRITRIETDDGEEPQLRACVRGRAYRQRIYAPDRILYPLKRIGERGEGKFKQISWDEALDTIATEIIRIRDTYGPASILHIRMAGDVCNLHNANRMAHLLALAGGFTETWGTPSFAGGIYAQQATYGTHYTCNMRDDLVNSRLIIMWGWNPAVTVTGVNTAWYLAQAREAGARIISVDPKYTDSAATFAHQWIPIHPGTDGAMLLAMAYIMIKENLQNQHFLDTYTIGFEPFKKYVTGVEDGIPKTPEWAEKITGVPTATIENLARQYATTRPAALLAGIAPGRTAYGEQYHRIAITVAAMTGNIGIHGGDAAGRAWEAATPFGGYPYQLPPGPAIDNPVNRTAAPLPPGLPWGYATTKVHTTDVPDFIEKGKSGGYQADCKLIAITNCNYVNSFPNINRIAKALKSEKVEFIFIQEQFMTASVRFADIVLPTNTYMERNDITTGVGLPFYGYMNKTVEPVGESKSHLEIAALLGERLGVPELSEQTEEIWLRNIVKGSEIPDYDRFRADGVYRLTLPSPYVAFQKQIEDPANNPFPTPSGKIEIYSQQWSDLNQPDIPPIPKYIESWEGRNDPLSASYPLQLISTHFGGRANAQFANVPWLQELFPQAVWINRVDAQARNISEGDRVRIFNDRGGILVPARVTERIMPGVVDVPHGAWYDPDEKGVDKGGCPNVLTRDAHSPGGAFTFNSCLVQVEKA